MPNHCKGIQHALETELQKAKKLASSKGLFPERQNMRLACQSEVEVSYLEPSTFGAF
jgi:hypothetical protein